MTNTPWPRRAIPLAGVLGSTALSITANSIVAVAVPWLVLERTGSAALAGLAGAAAIAPIAFCDAAGIEPVVVRTFPLAEGREALALLENGTPGKLVLTA